MTGSLLVVYNYWFKNYYYVKQIREKTTELGSKKRFSYEQFIEMTGITVDEYDANVDLYADMKYEDIKAYLESQTSEEIVS